MSLNKKHILSWCLFDFANSSYSAVIAAVVFPVYYSNVIVGNQGGEGDLWWGRAISLSMIIVALSSPFLGGIADYAGKRKRFLFIYTYLCILSVAAFSLLAQGMVIQGFLMIVLANIGLEEGLSSTMHSSLRSPRRTIREGSPHGDSGPVTPAPSYLF